MSKAILLQPQDINSVMTTRRGLNKWRRNWYGHLNASIYCGESRDNDQEAQERSHRYRMAQSWHLGVWAERCNQGGLVRHSAILSHPWTLRAFFVTAPIARVSFLGLLRSQIKHGWDVLTDQERETALRLVSVPAVARLEDNDKGFGTNGWYGEIVTYTAGDFRPQIEVCPKTDGVPDLVFERCVERWPYWHPEAGRYLPWCDFEENAGNWIMGSQLPRIRTSHPSAISTAKRAKTTV